jgi:ssDNA-binding Zn-finger/Zn-ribbon topoisomerase 1
MSRTAAHSHRSGTRRSEKIATRSDDGKCPECSGKLIRRNGYSEFLACSRYPKCKYTTQIPLPAGISKQQQKEISILKLSGRPGLVISRKLHIPLETVMSFLYDSR